MVFDEAYFEGEEREGFFVESMMKRAWAAQLEVLKVIEEICIRHNLRYFAEWGTLLGAVRHKGFIPWDDDMDIAMLRDDYEKFLVIAKEELPKDYALLCVYTDEGWKEPLARITNGRAMRFDKAHLERYHGCPYVVGIDIFPQDYMSRNETDEMVREEMLKAVSNARVVVREEPEELEECLLIVEELCNVKIDRTKPIERQLVILVDRLSQLFLPEEADEVSCIHHWVMFGDGKRKKKWYDKMIWKEFENTRIAVPDQMHECAKAIYGESYMTPIIRPRHEYPFYAKQERVYQKWFKANQVNRYEKND